LSRKGQRQRVNSVQLEDVAAAKTAVAPWRRRAWFELGAMTALLLSYIWLWQGAFADDFYVCVAAYFAVGLSSHVARGESAPSIGLRFDNFGRALIQVLIFIGPACWNQF
jgi:hypothetical protein